MNAKLLRDTDGVSQETVFNDGFVMKVESREPRSLPDWVRPRAIELNQALLKCGAILFRGFGATPADFKGLVSAVSGGAGSGIEYKGGTSPRAKTADGLYESTTYPAGAEIPQHHEMSYLTKWPLKAFLYCDTPSQTGGETPLCSNRVFHRKLSPAIFKMYQERQVIYARNYDLFGPTWQKAFESEDKAKVESFCREMKIDFQWLAGEKLRTRQLAQGVATHPLTGETFYFNQSHALNMYSTNPDRLGPFLHYFKPGLSAEMLHKLRNLPPEEMPFVSYFGDGGVIEDSVLQEILGIYEENKVSFPYQKGDVIMVDNMLSTHGRHSFTGPRKVLVAFTEV